jgi:hypothetical protein
MARVFFYYGHGVGLGGIITRPFQHLIDAKAAASLPITGGKSSASWGKHVVPDVKDPQSADLPKVVSIEETLTESHGTLDPDGVHRTRVTTTVHGLNVRDRVTADLVVGKLLTEHYPGEDEARISVAGSEIKGLKIDGVPVHVEFHHEVFEELNTHMKFKNKFDQDPNFRTQMRRQFLWGESDTKEIPEFLEEQYRFTSTQKSLPMSKGLVPCSVVKSVKGGKGFQAFNHVLVIPDFGKLFLGELLVLEQSRRLTMMRFALGSPVAGQIAVCGIDGNGTGYP